MENEKEKLRMTIFVSSPNEYQDVFQVYYQCINKYWKSCPYEVVLATNNQKYEGISVVNNYLSGDSWTERTIPVLQKIQSKYVLLMCDDILLIDDVDTIELSKILDDMDCYHINFCRLKPYKKGVQVSDSSNLLYLNRRAPYAKNLQIGIYNRDYLLELLGDGTKSAWKLECEWVKESLNAPNEFFDDIVACKNEVLPFVHGVIKGKWFPSAVFQLKRRSVWCKSDREILTKYQERKIKLISKVGYILSPRAKWRIKKLLSRFGFKFVTEN